MDTKSSANCVHHGHKWDLMNCNSFVKNLILNVLNFITSLFDHLLRNIFKHRIFCEITDFLSVNSCRVQKKCFRHSILIIFMYPFIRLCYAARFLYHISLDPQHLWAHTKWEVTFLNIDGSIQLTLCRIMKTKIFSSSV